VSFLGQLSKYQKYEKATEIQIVKFFSQSKDIPFVFSDSFFYFIFLKGFCCIYNRATFWCTNDCFSSCKSM